MGSGASNQSKSRTDLKTSKNNKSRKSKRKLQQQKSIHSWDAMISYSHQDTEKMLKLKEYLENNGMTIWVDVVGLKAGVDFLSKIGQAIIDSKLFISLLSCGTATSKYCQDELALAYISNKPIFPVGLENKDKLYENMDTGMRLQLARYEWESLTDENRYEENLQSLVNRMQKRLAEIQREQAQLAPSTLSLTKNEISTEEKSRLLNEKKQFFWERHFNVDDKIPWDKFVELLKKDFDEEIDELFIRKDDYGWLLSILARELNIEEYDGNVTHDEYLMFCTVDRQYISFWERIKEQAIESYTMREVFDMDSSVRVEAIENLAKFRSRSVVEALLDLLTDDDKNVQTVAAISLARTGAREPKVIRSLLKTLSSKDRLVRESGCLALGHLKVEEAVPKIVHLWRNDVISSVREAAQVALEQIGGQEAEKAMHMTKVLTDEIRMLMQE